MPYFCVNRNAQANGDHEVHDVSQQNWCLPTVDSRLDLGSQNSCREAVQAARSYYSQVNGCRWCARECHTS